MYDVDALVILRNAKDIGDRPVLNCMSSPRRAKGYAPAENAADKYHGVAKFNVVTGEQAKPQRRATPGFRRSAGARGRADDKIIAISAAMPAGTAGSVRPRNSSRTFDVGIAEQHAVTLAAGLPRTA